jgi:hypothetical protein
MSEIPDLPVVPDTDQTDIPQDTSALDPDPIDESVSQDPDFIPVDHSADAS